MLSLSIIAICFLAGASYGVLEQISAGPIIGALLVIISNVMESSPSATLADLECRKIRKTRKSKLPLIIGLPRTEEAKSLLEQRLRG